MTLDLATVAEDFIHLVFKYENWIEREGLSEKEREILFNLVDKAGFSIVKIIPIRLLEGSVRAVNSFCPGVVSTYQHQTDFFATGWLNQVFGYVLSTSGKLSTGEKSFHSLVDGVVKIMRESVPLAPLKITADDDYIVEPDPRVEFGNYLTKRRRDEDAFQKHVGMHRHCEGRIERVTVRESEDAIVCRGCYLRVIIPREVRTYGDLRRSIVEVSI